MKNNDTGFHFLISQNAVESFEKETVDEYFQSLNNYEKSESKEPTCSKNCLICGDKALGYNFGAITCESCKAFFRRNVNKITKCLFNDKCEIVINTRRFCTHCRLKKCFQANMRKDKTMENNKRKRTKPGEKDFDKQLISLEKNIPDSPDSSLVVMADKKSSNLNIIRKEIDNSDMNNEFSNWSSNIREDIKESGSSSSNDNLKDKFDSFKPTTIMSLLENSKLISMNDKLSREGLARLLSENDWNILFYIHKVYIDNFFDSGSMPPSAIENANLTNLVNSSSFLVRKLINFAKSLSEFISLEQPCQIALLKGAVLNSLILRSAVEYNTDKNIWITPQGEISSDIIGAAGLFELQDDYARYCRSFKKLLGSDEYLIAITQILCLFSSDNLSLTDRQFISDIHDKYLILLKHYLESIHGFVNSRSIFVLIISNLLDLQSLTSKHGQILLHIDPTNVDPLMLEVFNMNIAKNY